MPQLTMKQIFGDSVELDINPLEGTSKITFDLKDFQNEEDGGQIKNGLGITDLDSKLQFYADGEKAEAILYGLILMTSQNQDTDINEDIEKKLFITEGGTRLGIGARTGQIQRIANVNLFQDTEINNLPDIDSL